MKILYVADLFSGIKPVILHGALNPSGSPAFWEPLKLLINKGYQVDFVFPVQEKNVKENVGSNIIINSKIFLFNYRTNVITRIIREFCAVMYLIYLIKRYKYDFVYGHGSFGLFGNIAANITKTPAGMRVYGTFLYYRLKNNFWLRAVLRYYKQSIPFLISKCFLIVTNDGTKGDVVNKLIGNDKLYKFYFLVNGVDKGFFTKSKEDVKQKVLFYPARIEKWKNQEFAIELMFELRKAGIHDFKLILAGSIYDDGYWEKLQKRISELGLTDQVLYCGVTSKEELRRYYTTSFAVLSLYDFSNMGNVALEALTSGALLLTKKDGSLDSLFDEGKHFVSISSTENGVNKIKELLNSSSLYHQICTNAKTHANSVLQTWSERAEYEVKIIRDALKKR